MTETQWLLIGMKGLATTSFLLSGILFCLIDSNQHYYFHYLQNHNM